ncbi:MAG: glycosyltransferase [Candidatus Auribacter fodinae]|jgi:hypothetical protein|uniref:Glycosyltransferase n=1 Tax=Candidatus Auribacter fodinae TaxID=2093366 RepID=A0A3A4R0Z9_9BACT|nr:MAG: glycosyltransferase [Candidatus Auribacter fodinae]
MKKVLYLLLLFFAFSEICPARSKAAAAENIYIPDSIGSVEDSHQGSSDKTIVFIKDAHAFSEAQFNIAHIIQRLAQNHGVSLIGVEGAEGELTVDGFRFVPFTDARNSVADDYVKKGIFSGAEYAAIVSDKPLYLFGVEEKDLFLSNYKTFLNSLPQRDAIVVSFIELNTALADLKTYIFNNNLKKFEQYVNYYEDGKLDLGLFVSILYQHAKTYGIDLSLYHNLETIKESLDQSAAINFDLARAEQDTIRRELAEKINGLPIDRSSKTQVSGIISRKQTELSETNFARFILDFSDRMGRLDGPYAELRKFAEFGENTQGVDFALLSREISELVYEARIHMSTSDSERMLIEFGHYISRLEHILSLEAVRPDAQWFISDNKNSWERCMSFFRTETKRHNIPFQESDFKVIENALNTAYTFYAEAVKRDAAFVDNLLAKMGPGDTAVLVAGGFHEAGIIRILQDRDISYAAINPYISSSEPDIAYLDKMRGSLLPEEPAATSNITVSLLYTELFGNYPKLLQIFNMQTVRKTIDMLLKGEDSVERIVYRLYDNYELPFPTESYAQQFAARLKPALDELRELAKSSDTATAEIAGYLESRIMDSLTEAHDQLRSRGLPPPNKELAVSVVVPVYNEVQNGNIFAQIESFIQQDADPKTFELIYIVNNSFDEAMAKSEGFEDNQRLLALGAYLNAPQGTPPPAFFSEFSDRQRSIINEAKQKGLAIHFIDRSQRGLPGIVEKHGIRIGTLRNIGIFTSISRFESLSRNGFIANLDADTTIPTDYVSRLMQYSEQDGVDVVYTNLKYAFVGGNEFLFKTHFVQVADILSTRFPEYIVAKAPQDVGTVRIIARSDVFRQRGGFPDLTTGEDIAFTRLMQRAPYGLLSTPDLAVTTQDRMRERGFDSDMRNKLGQSMTPDEFVMKKALEQHSSIRIEFLKRYFRERSKQPISPEELESILKLYGFEVSPDHPGMAEFRASGSVHQLVQSLDENSRYYLSNIDDNVADFADKLLRNISEREHTLFRQLLDEEITKENADIMQFQQEFRSIYDTVWDRPDKASITTDQVAETIQSLATHPTLLILAGEKWFLEKIQQIGREPYKESYYNSLLSQFRDWANPIDDTKRNVFRKGQVYQRAFNTLLQKSIHFPESFPEFHEFLTSVTGHDYLIMSEPPAVSNAEQPQPANRTRFIDRQLLESSL